MFRRYYVDGPADYGDFMYYLTALMSPDAVFVASVGEAPLLELPAVSWAAQRLAGGLPPHQPPANGGACHQFLWDCFRTGCTCNAEVIEHIRFTAGSPGESVEMI